ncbi:MAG: rRNA pseudouridine synthase [Candidatus Dormibacteraeota bacterium]|uniref:Pseudouridine synthase n=1 Tax=Candidatus Aeolococcus gillhamiae TaxID=3127015 RepID=A0A2W5YZ78_9BACT|nr:rRNA pseudouridine synthase [Candidatus Dormibacteraeota bacterium]PZR78130.1 MAG: rRNA pseudouridine synthase [Candidatus Dormibacter sp. RRmetagenome_bin12]
MTPVAAGSGERLNRFLARRGVASRRAADQLIAAGRVRVNGEVAPVGARVDINTDTVVVDGAPVAAKPATAVTLALNKPPGVLTTMSDPQRRRTVRDLVTDIPGLVPIGRLDSDSRGLLLLTSDGDLAHRVAHPRHGVHKTYRVTTESSLSDAQLARLFDDVMLDDGPARALEVHRVGDAVVDVVMGEGRKRLVRRLFAAVGNGVVDLCRTRVGPIELGDLREGETRPLDDREVAALRGAETAPRT